MTLDSVVRVLGLAAMLGGLSGFVPLPLDGKILFPRGTAVPPQEPETLGPHLRPAYALRILSERSWQKTEPTASIEMTIVDDGGMRLAALRSTFITCEL